MSTKLRVVLYPVVVDSIHVVVVVDNGMVDLVVEVAVGLATVESVLAFAMIMKKGIFEIVQQSYKLFGLQTN